LTGWGARLRQRQIYSFVIFLIEATMNLIGCFSVYDSKV
jgi:hypothetical protein